MIPAVSDARLLARPRTAARQAKRDRLAPPVDPVWCCSYFLEKTCEVTCEDLICRMLNHQTQPLQDLTQARCWGRWHSTRPYNWVSPGHARVFLTIAEARAEIVRANLVHVVIVDRCHPWNRGLGLPLGRGISRAAGRLVT